MWWEQKKCDTNAGGCVNILTTFCHVLCDHFTEQLYGNMKSILLIKLYLAPWYSYCLQDIQQLLYIDNYCKLHIRLFLLIYKNIGLLNWPSALLNCLTVHALVIVIYMYMHLVLLWMLGIYVHVVVITVLSFHISHVEWKE